jgi:acyl-CoA synthetase (AMP-forming)/AMP-acid ligase II
MAEVACFCGCLYSFDGGAGACPKCGEYATVTAGPRAGAGGQNMIIQSPYDDIELAEIPVAEFVLGRAADCGGKPAIIDGSDGRAVSYGELAASVRRAAAGLAARGLAAGDVLALCSPNRPEFAVACYAAMAAGAVVTTVNPLAPPGEIAGQLLRSGARWLVITAAAWERGGREAAAAARVRETFVFGTADGATAFTWLAGQDHAGCPAAPGPDDVALLPFSSGTTGRPKGVMLTHRALVASLCQTRVAHGVRGDDVVLAVLPLFHIAGLQVALNLGLSQGATVVTMPRFDLETFLQLVQDYRVTRAMVVPPIVLALARHPAVPRYDLSSLRLITCGAAPLGAGLASECADRLGCPVTQGYGMTELGGATHIAPEGGDPGSIGPPLPGTQCRVIDCASGRDAGPGQAGELLIRTPGMMRGYLDDDQATADTIDPGGWLHTGDVVIAGRGGWFTVIDRVKELIKYKGSQVAPAALEAILLTHPAVADAAVIGSPDEEAGEIPTALVVLSQPATAGELASFVAGQVAPQEKVRRVEFVTSIPKSPSGKILRRLLAERLRPASTGTPVAAGRSR